MCAAAAGEPCGEPCDEEGGDVGEVVAGVGQEGQRAGGEAEDDFYGDKGGVEGDACDEGDIVTRLVCVAVLVHSIMYVGNPDVGVLVRWGGARAFGGAGAAMVM